MYATWNTGWLETMKSAPLATEQLWRLLGGLSTSSTSGDYLDTVTRELVTALGVDFAFVSELVETAPARARTLAVAAREGTVEGFEYDLEGTPCRQVLELGFHCVTRGARACFPHDATFARLGIEGYAGVLLAGDGRRGIGWLGVMSRTPLEPAPPLVRSLLELAGARVALELQVRAGRRELEELRETVERRLLLAGRERRRTEERLVQAALHDPLTGLPNRILFRRRLERALAAADPAAGHRVAVLFLDLDRFTLLNNSLGHHAGDELLRDVAACLGRCVGPGDTVARLGGDEFALLLARIDEVAEAAALAERVRCALARPFAIEGREVFTGTSIGVAVGGAGECPDRLLRDADVALHRAKERGRACHEIFHPTLHARMMDRLEVETDLRGAVDRGELRLAYQPILSRRENAVTGLEALVRWQHPRRGLVMPGDFIPLAEETGLVVPIGEWVLAEVAAQLDRWRGGPLGELAVSVNLSRRQLREPDFLGYVEELVRAGRLDGSRLHLEITESALAEDAMAAARVLAGIKRLGIRLVVDDFGTGYSSLASLVGLPVDRLKIDRSFVGGLDATPAHRDMVRAITRLAHDLRLEVIAEGVETRSQLAELARLEVDDVQGFLIAPPLGCAEAEAFVLAGGVALAGLLAS